MLGKRTDTIPFTKNIPYDILVEIAIIDGDKTAYSLAQTCKDLFKLINERYKIYKFVLASKLLDEKYKRRCALFGNFLSIHVNSIKQINSVYFFKNLQHLKIDCRYERGEFSIYFPPNLKTLEIHYTCDTSRFKFPINLEKLILNNCNLTGIRFPPNLKKLELNDISGFTPSLKIPDSVIELFLGRWFNQPVNSLKWLSKLRKITFGYNFYQPFNQLNLPDSVTELIFLDDINTEGDNLITFPPKLQKLKLCETYSHTVYAFPSSLVELEIEKLNCKENTLILPNKLRKFKIGYLFTAAIPNLTLPESLVELEFGEDFNKSLIKLNLPPKIKQIKFGSYYWYCLEHLKSRPDITIILHPDYYSIPYTWFRSLYRLCDFGFYLGAA